MAGHAPLAWLTLKGLACAYRYQGARSDHFDGDRFSNQPPMTDHGREEFKRWQKERKAYVVPWQWEQGPEVVWAAGEEVGEDDIRVTFVNHSTFLVQFQGLNILTDPVWSKRVSPFSFAGPKRFCAPGIDLEALPSIDAIWLSHNHYDHCDIRTLRALARRFPDITLFTGLGNASLCHDAGINNVVELDWWQSVDLHGHRLSFVPSRHWGARSLWDRRRTLWGGFVYESSAGPVYFAGDTGFGDFFDDIRQRFGAMILSLLPIGAYRPEWFMHSVHMSPDEAIEAHRLLGSRHSIACHFGCFALADDKQFEPEHRLVEVLQEQKIPLGRFVVPRRGISLDYPVTTDSA